MASAAFCAFRPIVPCKPLESCSGLRACAALRPDLALRSTSKTARWVSCLAAKPETLATVQEVIASQLSVDPSTVTPVSKFSDLGADSLDTVEIMMNLEESFKISLGEEGAEKIVTVQDAADLIEGVIAKSN